MSRVRWGSVLFVVIQVAVLDVVVVFAFGGVNRCPEAGSAGLMLELTRSWLLGSRLCQRPPRPSTTLHYNSRLPRA